MTILSKIIPFQEEKLFQAGQLFQKGETLSTGGEISGGGPLSTRYNEYTKDFLSC